MRVLPYLFIFSKWGLKIVLWISVNELTFLFVGTILTTVWGIPKVGQSNKWYVTKNKFLWESGFNKVENVLVLVRLNI
jgi:hypothetical protein